MQLQFAALLLATATGGVPGPVAGPAESSPGPTTEPTGQLSIVFAQREHTYLDGDQLLRYTPLSGHYEIIQLLRAPERRRGGRCAIFNPRKIRSGKLPPFRKLAYLGGDRLLESDPSSGSFRVLCFNRTAPCDLRASKAPALAEVSPLHHSRRRTPRACPRR